MTVRKLVCFIFLLFSSQIVSSAVIPEFVPLVKNNYASVVNISTTKKNTLSNRLRSAPALPGVDENTPLYDFLNYLLTPNKQKSSKKRFRNAQSSGSGFILSKDGYILTNAHVVKDAKQIFVTLSDQRELIAELIGTDKLTDVALLKIDEGNLPAVKIADSDKLEIGEWVLAIGSPFGFDHTASQGIISGLGRNLPHDTFVPFIQTDVSINPGNSGGPLFNLDGKVIGINSQIFTKSGGSIGLSFAIPINVALNVVKQLRDAGTVKRGWLGISIQDLTQDLAKSFGLRTPSGALISGVAPNSPSDEAGIQTGDIVTMFNGKAVERGANLIQQIGFAKVGSEVPISIIRGGEVRELIVSIKALSDDAAQQIAFATSGDLKIKELQLKISNVPDDIRNVAKVPQNGVLVKTVYRGPSGKAGIHKGDVISSINHQVVKNAQQFLSLVKNLPRGTPISVLVHRRTGPVFLVLKLNKGD